MNAGAAAAKGDILIFLHADTRLPMDALELIDKAMAQPGLPEALSTSAFAQTV